MSNNQIHWEKLPGIASIFLVGGIDSDDNFFLLSLLVPLALGGYTLGTTSLCQVLFEEEQQGRKNGRLHHTSAHHTTASFLLHLQTAKNPTNHTCSSLFKACESHMINT
jgi:hypothetical protein